MKIATSAQMHAIDIAAAEKYGIKSSMLMSRAGAALADHAHTLFPKNNILIICGNGNNGGDGLVAARKLISKKHKVSVIMLCDKKSLSPDCKRELSAAIKAGVSTKFSKALSEKDLRNCVVIDALFGTGLSRDITGSTADAIAAVNSSGLPVIAADIPSGISGDTGRVNGSAIRAQYTVTFVLPKRGHFLYPGAEHTGRLSVHDIGFPPALLESEEIMVELSGRDFVRSLFEPRLKNSHKGDYGHVLVVAGSTGKTGAARLAGSACLRSGAGLVTIGAADSLMSCFQSSAVEEMFVSLPDTGSGEISSQALSRILQLADSMADVMAIGPGIGVSGDTERLLTGLVTMSPVPMVVDADGLNALSSACAKKKNLAGLFQSSRSPMVLTPHPGEMKRLCDAAGIKEADRITNASELSRRTGAVVVLKGAHTAIAEPENRVYINTTGNPGMATAGSGDVLTGIIAAFIGQGIAPFHAATAGVFIHGLAGDLAAEELGEFSLTASDIIRYIPMAFISLEIV